MNALFMIIALCGTGMNVVDHDPIFLPGVPTPIVTDDDMHMLPIDPETGCRTYTVGSYGKHICADVKVTININMPQPVDAGVITSDAPASSKYK